MDDDLPLLESEPLLSASLSHTAAAAAAAADDDEQADTADARGKRGRRGGRGGRTAAGGRGGAAASAGGRRGQKRSRDDDDEDDDDSGDSDESDFSHSSDEQDDGGSDEAEDDDDELGARVEGVGAGAGAEAAAASSSYAAPAPRARRARRTTTKEVDINGVSRPVFPAVQLVQASVFLGREVNVLMIAKLANNAVFMPPGGVRFSLRRPSGYAKVNSSGKCVLMGGKSTMDMVTIARKIARKVQKIPEHGDVGFYDFKINNVAASGAFGFRVDLRALSDDPEYMDYTEYDPEQWTGLYYRLPVDPTKRLSDIIPTYASLMAARRKNGEQHSTEEFLGTTGMGANALVGKGQLNYYNTTATAGSRAKASLAGAGATGRLAPLKLPPSMNGQIITATIYNNGKVTFTGVKREKDIHDAFRRLFDILKPFALSEPPAQPPQMPPYILPYIPGQKRRVKREPVAQTATDGKYAASVMGPDVKPRILHGFVAPIAPMPVKGTFAVKAEAASSSLAAAAAAVAAVPPSSSAAVKSEPGVSVKPEPGMGGASAGDAIVIDGLPENGATATEHEDVEWE